MLAVRKINVSCNNSINVNDKVGDQLHTAEALIGDGEGPAPALPPLFDGRAVVRMRHGHHHRIDHQLQRDQTLQRFLTGPIHFTRRPGSHCRSSLLVINAIEEDDVTFDHECHKACHEHEVVVTSLPMRVSSRSRNLATRNAASFAHPDHVAITTR
jgi:hypothetical protein